MSRRIFSILMGLVLLGALTAAPALAGHPEGGSHHNNFAGRPLKGESAGTEAFNETACQIIAYGKVNSKYVAYTSFHCFDDPTKFDGRLMVDHNGVAFGYMPSNRNQCSQTYDLCFIWLGAPDRMPSNPHQVYAGRTTSGATVWTTISTYQGSSQWAASALPQRVGSNVYAYRQDLIANGTAPWVGSVTGLRNSEMRTDFQNFTDGRRWSGTPLMNCNTGGTCSLVGAGWYHVNGDVHFAPIRDGILAIHNYWLNNGLGTGAKFCTTAAC